MVLNNLLEILCFIYIRKENKTILQLSILENLSEYLKHAQYFFLNYGLFQYKYLNVNIHYYYYKIAYKKGSECQVIHL